MYYTYIIRCVDNSLYIGITSDIVRRMSEHKEKGKKCAKYTKVHGFKNLECYFLSLDRKMASRLEYHLKRLTKRQKEKIVRDGDFVRYLSNFKNSDYFFVGIFNKGNGE